MIDHFKRRNRTDYSFLLLGNGMICDDTRLIPFSVMTLPIMTWHGLARHASSQILPKALNVVAPTTTPIHTTNSDRERRKDVDTSRALLPHSHLFIYLFIYFRRVDNIITLLWPSRNPQMSRYPRSHPHYIPPWLLFLILTTSAQSPLHSTSARHTNVLTFHVIPLPIPPIHAPALSPHRRVYLISKEFLFLFLLLPFFGGDYTTVE